ncbi:MULTISPECIES: H-NS histone family protein [Burkholderia]|jgi:DNA-binding protein H-NS|uniref:DNA-binding protein Bv3F n=1 Tax=Burkholderia pseudomultivorans TaxID=1207504 RepID=A0ABU2EC28_9BURK|nr:MULTISPECIES: H-NS histone family protein [Burkholderia]MBR8428282.1 H-NS histone family protein [Burkholderia cenocepacia]MDN7669316.1 H-NS histone family protein [Burkholderia vietnamiensis]MDR8731159.1 DNA-binding protein Bv3F [Burkholderia pseudomultivorans]MDR8738752.1 DNA-binding protein Bv3F [Burkholderia pseudomultivorans]MDR8745335.1 DNA-binding protein Bv3F [Burkholderia pseudomultivorans]
MATYLELKAKAEEFAAKAEEARLSELQTVLDEVRARITEYGLTPEQVFGRQRATRSGSAAARPNGHATLPPMYQDPKTGNTWSGRGREPSWIKGKRRERFLIKS